jgi:hypothetical protein
MRLELEAECWCMKEESHSRRRSWLLNKTGRIGGRTWILDVVVYCGRWSVSGQGARGR